jgi:8-oxo-dGTP diphosphatase
LGANEQGANATDNRWLVIPRTLCFVLNGDDVLLMKRAAHRRVFPNQYNGVGGHVERNEDPETCARREIMEETGLTVTGLRLRGVYNIDTADNTGLVLYIYTAHSAQREITVHTDEGTLHWVNRAQAHQLDLVEDLPIIIPRVLSANDTTPPFAAHLSYDDSDELVIRFANEN